MESADDDGVNSTPIPVVCMPRPFADEEWPIYRATRFLALQSDPSSFSSTLAAESQLPDEFWMQRASNTIGLFTSDEPSQCVGLSACISSSFLEESDIRAHDGKRMCEVVSVWVAPEHRGAGNGEAVVRAAMSYAKGRGLWEVANISMNASNEGAVRLYRRIGFVDRCLDGVTFKPPVCGCDLRLQINL